AVSAVVNLDNTDPDHPDYLTAARAETLLLSQLGDLDAGEVRRLARALRVRDKALAAEEDRPATRSRELLRRVVVEPGFLDGVAGPESVAAGALHALLHTARAAYDAGSTAEELLWLLWSGTGWPERLRRSTENAGPAARRAHRDLDGICALFETAAHQEESRTHSGVRNFLESLRAQEFPADTLAERGIVGDAVRLLTAHRAKGLEWRLVVVAHVQQDGWPDLRRRTTLLQADRIGVDGVSPPVSTREQLQEERRLFYVACTRARQRLVVTAVASSDDDGEQPSGLVHDLGVPVEHRFGRPARALSLAALVAELRRTAAHPDTPEPLREAAARRLALLAREEHAGRRLVPQADPASWWGTRAASASTEPIRPADRPVPLSASALDALMTCPTRWFLEREAGGVTREHQAANLGQIAHALADRVAKGEIGQADGADEALDELMVHVDAVWHRLEFRTAWSGTREHDRIRRALARFLAWHRGNPRQLLSTEQEFRTVVDLDDGEHVELSGYADRLELDHDGRVVVVDLKSGRSAPSTSSVRTHRQLGLYQYVVDHGGVDRLVEPVTGTPGESGGAELVQIGIADESPAAMVQPQPVQTDESAERLVLRDELGRAAGHLRRETFPAVVGQHCRDCRFVALCPVKGAGAVVTT
ncbi:MAG: uvrD 2, partial [Nocardioidaceae bacterium]|nr:uvrD 2 [Nocardioidaceae bacterium]